MSKIVEFDENQVTSDDVLDDFASNKGRVESLFGDNDAITALVESVIATIAQRDDSRMGDDQNQNLMSFFISLPKEVGKSAWHSLLKESKSKGIVVKWQHSSDLTAHLRSIFISS